ncbi:MAG: hypothetical protein QOE58_3200, partial [Actinomycetota bacterium]|nr:hypothetical protein [Actinomycetota bacterium]
MPVRLSPGASQRVAALALAITSLVASAALGSIFLGTARDAWTAIAAAGPAGPADGILLVAGLSGGLLSLWLGLGMALSALAALPGALGHVCRGLAGRVAPAAMRKVVAFVLGTTLTAALVPGTALAGVGHESLRSPVVAAAEHAQSNLAIAAPDASFRLAGGHPSVEDNVTGVNNDTRVNNASGVNNVAQVNGFMEAAPPPTWSPEGDAHPAQEVVVLRGDTLWSIAAHHLGPAAGAAEIDAEWHR